MTAGAAAFADPRLAAVGAAREAPSFDVLGTRIHALTLEQTVSLLHARIVSREPAQVSVCTVNDIVESLWSQEFRESLAGSWLATPDGVPLVWWGRLATPHPVGRVYGPDLMRAMLADPRRATRHFFYGGQPGMAEKLVAMARRSNREVRIAGVITPPFRPLTPEEEARTADAINFAAPDVVWVALGCPKQNFWMTRFRPLLDAPLLIGVGAAFDFLTGLKPQAPRWLQRAGLEWLFRLLCEPRRLWRRYLIRNAVFVFHALAYAVGLRDYPVEPPTPCGEAHPWR